MRNNGNLKSFWVFAVLLLMLIFHWTGYDSIQTQEIQENKENPCEEKKEGRKNLHNVLESIDIKWLKHQFANIQTLWSSYQSYHVYYKVSSWQVSLSRLCSKTATNVWRLEQLFAVLSKPRKSSFLSGHIKHEKVNDFIENYKLCDFLEH